MEKELFDFVKNAYTSGLCDEYKDEIRKCHEDKQRLVELAMRQQSIPYVATKMHEGIITKEYLQKSYGGFLNGFILKDCDGVNGYTYSWYLDYDYDNDLVVDVDVAHISYTVGANIVIPSTKCPILYISNRSNVHLICSGYNTIKIYMFDKTRVTIEEADNDSTILVYKYSDACKVEYGKYCLCDKIKCFNKELRL